MPNIHITPTQKSNLPNVAVGNLKSSDFGFFFSDHSFIADYQDGKWTNARIVPYDKMHFAPSLSALHYGQAIFEGMKAHRLRDGGVGVFRLPAHRARFQLSAERLCMPRMDEKLFTEGLKTLVAMDKDWVGKNEGDALYIRPFMFALDEQIMAMPSRTYRFMIICSPVAPYFSKNLSIKVEDKYARAAKGGVGFAKAAGNYAGGFFPTRLAQEEGFDQILWLDAETHTKVQECGVMNVMFRINDIFITPSLETKTILAGVTRDSAIHILKSKGCQVQEREVSMQELIEASKANTLQEILGLGTAASVSFVEKLTYKGQEMSVSQKDFPKGREIKQWIHEARCGLVPAPVCADWVSRV